MSVQINSGTSTTTITTGTTISTDVDIFPVGTSINSSDYVYDGQTILMINSTLNPNSNVVKAQYYDPVYGGIPPGTNSGFSDWNYDLVANSYLNGSYSASSLLSEPTYLFNNLQPISSSLGNYTLDIENGAVHTNGSGDSSATLFFSLTSQPYVSYQGTFYSTPGSNNVVPGYSQQNNSDNFIYTSNYYVQQKNEILIVQLVFTISNTNSLNANNVTVGTTSGAPTVSVMIYNKVISKDALSSLASGSTTDAQKTKVYSAGPVPLVFNQGGNPFDPKKGCFNIHNNIPIVIAPGYSKQYATVPVIYVPPYGTTESGNVTYYPQYLNDSNSSPTSGYIIQDNLPLVNINNVSPVSTYECSYGHFVIGIAYSSDYATFQPGASIYSEVLIKNVWRSPISIYKSYQAFSTTDMATKQVVLLFGKTFNGGTFLVTNSGTPIQLIDNYAVTSLRNFMNIMRAITTYFDGTVSLVDYFINANVVQQINTVSSANIQVLTLQPLLDGSITNPPTVVNNPNMYYLLIKSPNTVNLSVDPTNQTVFGENIGARYFGLTGSTLCATGDARYYNSELNLLSVSSGILFANSLYIGINTINNQNFYTLLILPEALFNGNAQSTTNNLFYIYSTPSTLFYINSSTNTSAQFVPSSTSLTTTSSTNGTINSTPTYNISKLILSASNVKII
jgi:hypothetical protein